MHNALAFAVWLHPAGSGLAAEHTQAMDLCVCITLGCLFLLLGSFAAMALVIWRRTTRPKPHIRLLMELEAGADDPKEAQQAGRLQRDRPVVPWEKSADWWQQ